MSRPPWYQLPAEVVLVIFGGLLAYALCRALYGLAVAPATLAGISTMFVVVLAIYYGHRLRAMQLESLPLEEQIAASWRLVRRGLIASIVGLLAAASGFLAVYLIWHGAMLLSLIPLAASLALSVLALLIVRGGWPRPRTHT